MTKTELAKVLAKKCDMTNYEARDAVDVIFEMIIPAELAAGGKVSVHGFGTFSTVDRAARRGHNPMTGEPINIPAKTHPKFKPGSKLTTLLNS